MLDMVVGYQTVLPALAASSDLYRPKDIVLLEAFTGLSHKSFEDLTVPKHLDGMLES